MEDRPIGILDSGFGGLSVWREIVALLPQESTIYIGDSANAPYGKKTSSEIVTLAKRLIAFLQKQEVKLVVVACNTITLNGIDLLREAFPNTLIIGTVPVIKGAANTTKTKNIGLLATTAGAKSRYIQSLIKTYASDAKVSIVATDDLVPLIEEGKTDTEEMKKLLTKTLTPFVDSAIDTLVLGSTHFPFLKAHMRAVLGDSCTILDSGPAIARQVRRVLADKGLLSLQERPTHRLYTTGDREKFSIIAQKLLDIDFTDGLEAEAVTL